MTAHKEQLQIELTEHPVKGQHDSFDLSTALAKIKAYGYVIAVDDIGCGQNPCHWSLPILKMWIV